MISNLTFFTGMHRKSMEAAETLKNSDDNSDPEETRTEASDISAGSSLNNQRSSPIKSPPISINNNNLNNNNIPTSNAISNLSPTSTNSSTINNSSTSISTTASPTPQQPPQKSPINQQMQQAAKPPSIHSHLQPHHHSPDVKDFKLNTSPQTGLTAQNAYHEDPEAFRWVTDYNRDPVSFIR